MTTTIHPRYSCGVLSIRRLKAIFKKHVRFKRKWGKNYNSCSGKTVFWWKHINVWHNWWTGYSMSINVTRTPKVEYGNHWCVKVKYMPQNDILLMMQFKVHHDARWQTWRRWKTTIDSERKKWISDRQVELHTTDIYKKRYKEKFPSYIHYYYP